ncbi:MAG: 4-hydroxy-tetrahydrodipicolinate synthase [Rikenellaceae bacterium]|nr:4-hydroxy-tetrahydrodipicolinate synthase [Rikenellaceae bacterium]
MKYNLMGTGVALVTPFDKNKEIDYPALGRLVDYVIAGGADYLVALGTTAETPTLSSEEKKSVASFIRTQNAGRVPLVLGIGGNNTREVIRQIQEYDLEGVEAILSVTPYYNKPSQEGIFQHYLALAESSPRPLILYNVPARTGVNMTAETTLRLARHENIAAIKEAAGNIPQISYILRDKPEDFLVISGDDNMALPLIALGGDGIISVAANAYPEPVSRMVQLSLAGDFGRAAAIQLQILECIETLFSEGNPVGVKAALHLKGLIQNELRLPLMACSDGLCEKLEELAARYHL